VSAAAPETAIAGRVAQFFIQENYADADVARFAGLSDEAAGQLDLNPRNNAEDMASCILRRDPRAVRALLDTPSDSAEEAAAIRPLLPHLAPCTAAGETVELNHAAIRLLLAAGLYRAFSVTSPAPAPAR
jgi:hypothetical protein